MTPEGQILKCCLDWLAAERILSWRVNTGGVVSEYKGKKRFHSYGKPGHSDIVAIRNGYVSFIEVKTPKGKQSELQKEFERDVLANGCGYTIVRSVEDLIEYFTQH